MNDSNISCALPSLWDSQHNRDTPATPQICWSGPSPSPADTGNTLADNRTMAMEKETEVRWNKTLKYPPPYLTSKNTAYPNIITSRWAGVQDSEDPLWNDNHSSILLNCCDLAELLKVQ